MKIRAIFNVVHFISAILACIFLAFQLIIISVNVIMRYFFNSGISWTEEILTNVLRTEFSNRIFEFSFLLISIPQELNGGFRFLLEQSVGWGLNKKAPHPKSGRGARCSFLKAENSLGTSDTIQPGIP